MVQSKSPRGLTQEAIEVRLFFRRANPTGNVSIESSFEEMVASFPVDSRFELSSFYSSYYSAGLILRLKAIREVWRCRAAVNHVTGDVNFLALALPGKRTLLTIHDCGLLDGKGKVARWVLWKFWLQLPVRHARIVSVVSEATKQDVVRLTGCSPQKVVVIPTVIKSGLTYSPKVFNKECPTFLHIGNSANKNLERHAEALAGKSCLLHVIGRISESQVALLKKLHIDHRISVNLSHQEMEQAYIDADVLLFCSTIEGFGMPILEAQTIGRVVVTSNVSAMPDVAGQGAAFANPLDVGDIEAAVARVWHEDDYRTGLIRNGLENVLRFKAKVVARAYEGVYGRLVKSEK